MAIPVVAQETGGQVSGVVSDPSGAVVPDATVTVTNLVTGRVTTTTSDDNGAFALRNLDPGRYKVRFEKSGFAAAEIADANILVGRTVRLEQRLSVGQVTTNVTVVEQATLVDLTTAVVSHNVTEEEFNRMPKGRSFQEIATSAPGVTSGRIEGGSGLPEFNPSHPAKQSGSLHFSTWITRTLLKLWACRKSVIVYRASTKQTAFKFLWGGLSL